MATFNQQNQTVKNQINAETINLTQVQSQEDFFSRLEDFYALLEKSKDSSAIDQQNAIDAQAHIKQALLQKHETKPDKKTLLDHLTSARELVAQVEGLSAAIAGVIANIGALFK